MLWWNHHNHQASSTMYPILNHHHVRQRLPYSIFYPKTQAIVSFPKTLVVYFPINLQEMCDDIISSILRQFPPVARSSPETVSQHRNRHRHPYPVGSDRAPRSGLMMNFQFLPVDRAGSPISNSPFSSKSDSVTVDGKSFLHRINRHKPVSH